MARYRIIVTPAMGAPGFLQRKLRSENIFLPHSGAVLERPDLFEPFETLSRTKADAYVSLINGNPGGASRADVMEWSKA